MCCTTLAVQVPMMTTQLRPSACYEVCWPKQIEQKTEFRPLRMKWVVVIDESGNRPLRMCWRADRDD
jgi:hypothetical protein